MSADDAAPVCAVVGAGPGNGRAIQSGRPYEYVGRNTLCEHRCGYSH